MSYRGSRSIGYIGGESPEAFRMMRRLYDPLIKREENFMTMAWESAELGWSEFPIRVNCFGCLDGARCCLATWPASLACIGRKHRISSTSTARFFFRQPSLGVY